MDLTQQNAEPIQHRSRDKVRRRIVSRRLRSFYDGLIALFDDDVKTGYRRLLDDGTRVHH